MEPRVTPEPSQLPRWLRRLGRSALGLVFPECCLYCGDDLEEAASTEQTNSIALCDACRGRLLQDEREACWKCGCPIGPYLPQQARCLKCQRSDYRFHEVIRLGPYSNELRNAVIQGKAPQHRQLCVSLSRLLCQVQRGRLQAIAADLVVPVPSHWLKRLFVPHHQADVLAETVASELDLPFRPKCLRKIRHTVDQSDLPREQRLKNLQDSFRVTRPQDVSNRIVLLIDDVLTTRTTASECARALRQAGAKRVIVAAIAAVE